MLTIVSLLLGYVTASESSYFSEELGLSASFPSSLSSSALPSDPGFMRGYLLAAAAADPAKNAVCLDGSPGVHYFRKGNGTGTNKWFLSQQGGGWCDSMDSCAGRATMAMGSTKGDLPSMVLNTDYFSPDAKINPLMYNWNIVFMRYCDGGSQSGDAPNAVYVNENTTLHFRGRALLDAHIEALLNDRGMNKATDVVVSGGSAGGLAAFIHCDHWAKHIGTATSGKAKVVCMPDSGFFLDVTTGTNYHMQMQQVYTLHQSSAAGLNAACVAAESDPSNCIYAEHTMKYIKTPVFMLQSQYDTYQSSVCAGACSGWPATNCNPVILNAFGKQFTNVMAAVLKANPVHAVFLDSCQHHAGVGEIPPLGGIWSNSIIDGDTQATAMKKWYEQGSAALPNKGFYNQNKLFPCVDCCNMGPARVSPNCVQPVVGGCADSCCNATAYCGQCGKCQNTKDGPDCPKCWKDGLCFPPCQPCYVPYPSCANAQCKECCEGGPCYNCQQCANDKTGLCAHCWDMQCLPGCQPCWPSLNKTSN